ncbi:BLUF domain-containing protein [Caenimonas terrae]|uniref:BLUF domain-containing protein n=1 Tax=Caenimonas terrae TaxID=696074 RepID=A0ABW0NB44_9BURK
MPDPLHSFVYASSATTLFTDHELEVLLEQARENNRVHQVTGMLLYCDGNFFQALEGTEPALEAVLARIRPSSRHRGLITLYYEPIAQREFGGWDMAFRRMDRAEFQRLNIGSTPTRLLLRSFLEPGR